MSEHHNAPKVHEPTPSTKTILQATSPAGDLRDAEVAGLVYGAG
jgi:hypothetical protein